MRRLKPVNARLEVFPSPLDGLPNLQSQPQSSQSPERTKPRRYRTIAFLL